MKYTCDTNFILRYLMADDPVQFEETRKIFDEAKHGKKTLVIEQAVFTEVIYVLSSFYKVPRSKIVEILSELLSYKGIESDLTLLSLALENYAKSNLHIVDCILYSSAKLRKIPLLTFDKELASYGNR